MKIKKATRAEPPPPKSKRGFRSLRTNQPNKQKEKDLPPAEAGKREKKMKFTEERLFEIAEEKEFAREMGE